MWLPHEFTREAEARYASKREQRGLRRSEETLLALKLDERSVGAELRSSRP